MADTSQPAAVGKGTGKREAPCPICGKPRDKRYRPFCSALCRDRDLINWLDGAYAVPAVEVEDDDEDRPARGEE